MAAITVQRQPVSREYLPSAHELPFMPRFMHGDDEHSMMFVLFVPPFFHARIGMQP